MILANGGLFEEKKPGQKMHVHCKHKTYVQKYISSDDILKTFLFNYFQWKTIAQENGACWSTKQYKDQTSSQHHCVFSCPGSSIPDLGQ